MQQYLDKTKLKYKKTGGDEKMGLCIACGKNAEENEDAMCVNCAGGRAFMCLEC